MSQTVQKLAILGGEPAVTVDASEQWQRPVEEEMKLIRELVEAGQISMSGAGLPKEFEEQFREYVGAEYCLALDHGHTALASAFWAVGCGPGDEFITPTVGYIGAFAGALHMGARPVFAEPDPATLLMDPDDVERRITSRTRFILPIHMGGNLCNMDRYLEIGEKYGIAIIEDASHCHGAEWDGVKIGSVSDITCFSMQGANPTGKPVAAGEGGLLTTNNRELYERCLVYGHLHRPGLVEELTNPAYKIFDATGLGWKFRAHPLALAIAKVSLDNLDYRIALSDRYTAEVFSFLEEIPGVRVPGTYPKAKPNYMYGGLKLVYEPDELAGLPIERFVEALKAEGVPVGRIGLGHVEHLRPIFQRGFDLWGHDRGPLGSDWQPYKMGDFPIAEDLHSRVFSLPNMVQPAEGLLEQWRIAFEKVTTNYGALI